MSARHRRYQTLPNLRALKRKKAYKEPHDGGGILGGLLQGAEALGRHMGGLSSLAGDALNFLGGGGTGGGGVLRRREGTCSFHRKGHSNSNNNNNTQRSASEDPLPQGRQTPRREKPGGHQQHRGGRRSLGHVRGHSLGHIPTQSSEEGDISNTFSYHHPPGPHEGGGLGWEDKDGDLTQPHYDWNEVNIPFFYFFLPCFYCLRLPWTQDVHFCSKRNVFKNHHFVFVFRCCSVHHF